MKRGLKKNQVMIAALAVMIAAAGYLNYTGRLFGTEKDDTTQTSADLTNQELLDISEEDTATGSEDILSNDSETEGTPGEAVLTIQPLRLLWHRQKCPENRLWHKVKKHCSQSLIIKISAMSRSRMQSIRWWH